MTIQKFTQKYVVVHLIKPLEDGAEFMMQDWPLHVTLANVFAVSSSADDLLQDLQSAFQSHPVFTSTIEREAYYGENQEVHVMLLQKNEAILQLHREVVAVLDRHDVVFNDPQWVRDGYGPHSTVQKVGKLEAGDEVTFDSLTLVDMFVGGDYRKRRVIGTVNFS